VREFLKGHRTVQQLEADAAQTRKQVEAAYCEPTEGERTA